MARLGNTEFNSSPTSIPSTPLTSRALRDHVTFFPVESRLHAIGVKVTKQDLRIAAYIPSRCAAELSECSYAYAEIKSIYFCHSL